MKIPSSYKEIIKSIYPVTFITFSSWALAIVAGRHLPKKSCLWQIRHAVKHSKWEKYDQLCPTKFDSHLTSLIMIQISDMNLFWIKTEALSLWLCGNCAFPQNFHSRKLGIWYFSAAAINQKKLVSSENPGQNIWAIAKNQAK